MQAIKNHKQAKHSHFQSEENEMKKKAKNAPWSWWKLLLGGTPAAINGRGPLNEESHFIPTN